MTKESNTLSPEGYPILILSFLLALALFFVDVTVGILGFFWVLFCVYFFRNPSRKKTEIPGALLTPADGTVLQVTEAVEPNFLKKKMKLVSVFMSPFNVHVNRSPASGVVKDVVYHKGRFGAAFALDATVKNERSAVRFQTKEGAEIVFVQVAGWFARRIINYLKVDRQIEQGSIFGVIKFGSRADIYFPEDYEVTVSVKQKVFAGETIIARKKL